MGRLPHRAKTFEEDEGDQSIVGPYIRMLPTRTSDISKLLLLVG